MPGGQRAGGKAWVQPRLAPLASAARRRPGSRPGRRVARGGVAGRARPGRDVTSGALCIVGIPGPPRVVPVHWFQRSRAEGASAGRAGGKRGGVGGQAGVRSGPAQEADRARAPHRAAARIRGSVSRCEEDNVSSGWNYSDQTVPRRKVNRIKMVTAIILHVTCVTCISVVRSFSSRELLLGTVSLTFDGLSFHSNLKDGSSQMGVIE